MVFISKVKLFMYRHDVNSKEQVTCFTMKIHKIKKVLYVHVQSSRASLKGDETTTIQLLFQLFLLSSDELHVNSISCFFVILIELSVINSYY